MSPLFSLSRELRAQIIEHVLNATASPPEFPPKSDAIIYSDIKYRAWVGHRHAYYSQRPSSLTPNCLPLLLVNRQLSNETRALITSRAPDYALDIAIEDECFVYLTWLSVPFLSGHISTLTVTVRLFGSVIPDHLLKHQLGSDGRVGFHYTLLAVLERFVRYGPVREKRCFGTNVEFEDRDLWIERIVLDFQSRPAFNMYTGKELIFPPADIGCWRWQARHRGNRVRAGSELTYQASSYKSRPEWMAELLESWVYWAVNKSDRFAKEWGSPLLDHVEMLVMLVEGNHFADYEIIPDPSSSDPSSIASSSGVPESE
ncbi:hypothetical protein POX_d05965 [Penicillium oxalicum]|uniref:hypothetical protein n=1 Tax=Penicillium oxalicum TaxID=69781 RepID=UPI0020B80D52|nr:hypothetical protein POX_d05965 [Penicillium oxalicum]KAI2790449.1 hypothetical protein POX_d05965 [Penicillium oxalicum]